MDSYADIWEGTTARVRFTHEDQDGVGFQPTTLTVSLYDYATKVVINGRNEQALTVASYIDANGILTFDFQPADSVFVDAANREELHILRFRTTWSSGTRVALFELPFNLRAVTNL